VISGCSAGGLATYLHVDHWADKLPDAKVRGLADSGFILDYHSPNTKDFRPKMKWVFNAMEAKSALNQACIADNWGADWKCTFAEYTLPYVVTPTFVLNSQYDKAQILGFFGTPSEVDMINAFGRNLTARVLSAISTNPGHGTFLDSCYHHCGYWNAFNVGADTQATAFSKWYKLGSQEIASKGQFIQGKTYPCPDCCKRQHNLIQNEAMLVEHLIVV